MIARGVTLKPERMLANISRSGGMILSEAIMLKLGARLGRQDAHDVVYDVAQAVATDGGAFDTALMEHPEVRESMTSDELSELLDPAAYTGLCSRMAAEQAERARQVAALLRV